MVLPPGVSHHPNEVCKLKKTLSSLKQALHAMYDSIERYLDY